MSTHRVSCPSAAHCPTRFHTLTLWGLQPPGARSPTVPFVQPPEPTLKVAASYLTQRHQEDGLGLTCPMCRAGCEAMALAEREAGETYELPQGKGPDSKARLPLQSVRTDTCQGHQLGC